MKKDRLLLPSYFLGAILAVRRLSSSSAAALNSPSSYMRWNSRYFPATNTMTSAKNDENILSLVSLSNTEKREFVAE